MAKNKLPVEKLSAKAKKAIPVKIVSDTAECSPKINEKWRAEDDLRALQRAAEIQSDKSRMSAAKAIAKEQMSALQKVAK